MPTEIEIKTKYKTLHNDLTESYYGGKNKLTKAEFDLQHGKVWSDMEAELIAEGYLKPLVLPRDLEAGIDALKAEVEKLKAMLGKK